MISIIVPTLNEEKVIEETLRRLQPLRKLGHEIIVSDGKSSDKTVELAKPFADRIVVDPEPEKKNIARGKNLGAAEARGDLLVFIDADVEIPDTEKFFRKLAEMFQSNQRLAALTVPIRVRPEAETFGDKIIFGLLNGLYVFSNNVLRVGNASGEFQAVRAAAFKNVRGYREDLVTGEDNDLFYRLSRIGRTLVETSLCVLHSGRRARATGWMKLLFQWIVSGVCVFIFGKSPFKKWRVVR
ncbi:glycosyltransferase [Candidatus Parcubacteria bacterium]|nr:MAG: glycosyltransferase [Candidatus Parcubacteria bacterium]